MLKKYPVRKTVTNFYSTFDDSRYKSWEHCFLFYENEIYKYIGSNIEEEMLDHASLHLAFYLASWGMMRGSIFLLQSDYKVHKNLIKNVLLNEKYRPLWNFDFYNAQKKEVDNFLYLIFDKEQGIKNAIINAYPCAKNSKGKSCKPSDTLITKIIMGTLGCIPAYDRYFMDGISYAQKFSDGEIKFTQQLGAGSLETLIYFIKNNFEELCTINKTLDFEYPFMKLIDMYFWSIGFDEEKKKKTLN